MKTNRYLAFNEPFRSRVSQAGSWQTGYVSFTNEDSINGNNHNWPYSKGIGDAGGDVGISHTSWEVSGVSKFIRKDGSGGVLYDGPVVVTGGSTAGAPAGFALDSFGTRNALGATAIARTIPTNPTSNLANALGEIRNDGLPKLPGMSAYQSRGASGLADEHLNAQFGILPLVSDMRDIAHSVKNSERILRAYRRGSDKGIRRRYEFPPETNSWISNRSIVNLCAGLGSPYGQVSVTSEKRTWFSGCYRYHVPSGNSPVERVQRFEQEANKLLGTRITPSTVWELAPWSWAADWVSNTGDIIHNISALSRDGLVLQYGYLMQSVKTVTEYTYIGSISDGRSNVDVKATTRFTSEQKSRRQATPYGFGLDTSGFTTRQWSILGALGISKSPGKLARS